MNVAIIIGRVVRDPELKFIPSSGLAVTKMTIAVDRDLFGDKKQQAISQGKPTADFIPVTIFGKMAESSAQFLAKGSQVAVKGRINTGSYTKDDGTKVYTTDILADKVEFLGSKADGQAKPSGNNFSDFPDEDVFTPVDDSEDPPF
jgi:single-strand DNA-binding protein